MKTIATKSTKAVTPRSQPSRKGTKAWRRNVDIRPEEKALDEKRESERLGMPNLATAADDDVFAVDVAANAATAALATVRGARKLRIDEILTPKSGVLAVATKPKHLDAAAAGKRDSRTLSASERTRVKRAGVTKERRDKNGTAPESAPELDIWGSAPPSAAVVAAEILAQNASDFLPVVVPIRRPKTLMPKAKAALPAVTVAPAGASYNPTFESHQELLLAAIAEEEQRITQLEAVMVQVPQKGSMTDAAMIIDGDDDASDAETNGDAAQQGESYVAPPTRKLTRTERNRQTRRKAHEAAALRKKQEKELRARMEQLESMHAELALYEAAREARTVERRKRRAESELKPAKLAKRRYVAPPLAMGVQLTEDLAGSLRELKPEGDVAKDRFESMQSRNMIEARVPTTHKRKFALKVYQKRDYRDFV
ncbi:ribosome biogenesis protein Nop53/GLTSCR2 [Blastocladiella britannica]|nr:ribosome biogenesis protein Nop53/GLTSCR2 [Blastocladiella britannica]